MLNCGMRRANPLVRFLLFWAVHTLTLWVAGQVFSTVHFDGLQALLVAGLLFGINALMLMLTAWLVPGFHLTGGFWHTVLIALFVSVLSFLVNLLFGLSRQQ